MNAPSKLYDGIKAGGAKFACAIGNERGDILDLTRLPTRDQNSTVGETLRYFAAAEANVGTVSAFGLSATVIGVCGSPPTTPKPNFGT